MRLRTFRFRSRLAPLVLALVAGPALRAEAEAADAAASHPAPAHGPAQPAAAHAEPAPPASAHSAPAAAPAAPKADHSNPDGPLPGAEIQSMLKLGASLTERGDYDAAEIAYRQVMRGRGVPLNDIKTALLGLARMHRRQGALTKAAAIYESFLKEYPEDVRTPDALLELGRTIRGLGTYNLAITRFYSVINSTLKLPGEGFEHYQLLAKTAQFEIAETYFQAGNFAEATKFFTRLRLLDLAPADRARAHFKAAYAQHLEGKSSDAVTTLRAYLEQWPDDENVPEARYLLAVSLRQLNRPQEAFIVTLELLRTAQSKLAADPKRWAYWQRRTGNQLANDFFAAGDILNAQAIYGGLVELSPDPAWRLPINYQIALCQERLGNTELALATYRKIVEVAGPAPAAELTELVRMSNWRISHLDWNSQTSRQISSLFETTTGRAPQPALAPPPAPAPVATPAPAGPSKTAALP